MMEACGLGTHTSRVACEDARYAAIPVFAVGTGLRPEEWIGLHRSDIHWEAR